VTTASAGDAAVDLSSTGTIVSYLDSDQAVDLDFVAGPEDTPGWGTTWLVGTGPILEPGERVKFVVNLNGLTTLLTERTEFVIQVKPSQGAVLPLARTPPAELTGFSDLH
jgi:hypothetical protein